MAPDDETFDPDWPWTLGPYRVFPTGPLRLVVVDGSWSAGTLMACGTMLYGCGDSSSDGSMEVYQSALIRHEQSCHACLAAKRLGHDRGHA